MSSVQGDGRAVVDVLSSDDITAEFFQEELNTLPQQRDVDLASISAVSTNVKPSRNPLDSLRRSFSHMSMDSVNLNGKQRFTLPELCDFIATHESLQTADIVSCSCYAVPSAFFLIPHRFLILQLQRDGRRDVWMRLDRRPPSNVGPSALSLALGVTPSNDTAMLASSRELLIPPNSTNENKIAFTQPRLLAQLRLTLLDVIVVMDQYKLTSENCWAFCSLLQDDMFKEGQAWFKVGRILHSSLVQKAKVRLFHRRLPALLSPHDVSEYVPFSTLIRDLEASPRTNRTIDQAVEVARRWEDSDDLTALASGRRLLIRELVSSIRTLSARPTLIYSNPDSQLVLQATALCRQLTRGTGALWVMPTTGVLSDCTSLLHLHGSSYLKTTPQQPDKALLLLEETRSLFVLGTTFNSNAGSLHHSHALALHALGRADETKPIILEFIECVRHEEHIYLWSDRMKDLRARGMWPSEFDYLLDRVEGGLPRWNYWHQDQIEFRHSIPDPC